MANQTNEQGFTGKRDKKAEEKETSGWKSAGTAGAGAASGAVAATAIKYSDDVIRFVAGDGEEDGQSESPEPDPNMPESAAENPGEVSTSASAIAQDPVPEQSPPATEMHTNIETPRNKISNSGQEHAQGTELQDDHEDVLNSVDVYMLDTDSDGIFDTVALDVDNDDIIDSTYSIDSEGEVTMFEEVVETDAQETDHFNISEEYDRTDHFSIEDTEEGDESEDSDWDAYDPQNII